MENPGHQTIQNEIQTSVQPAPELTNNFSKNKFLNKKLPVLGFTILILILIGAGASYLILNSNKHIACTTEAKLCPNGSSVGRTGPKCEFPKCPTINPPQSIVPFPTLTAAETTTWKTYNNKNYKFQIKYPGTITYHDDGKNVEFYIATPSAINKIGQLVGPRLAIYWRGDDQTPTKEASFELSKQSQKSVSFNNAYGVQVSNRFDYYLTSNSGKESVFRLMYYDDLLQTSYKENINELLEIFNKMLSTLKFNDQISTTPTCRPRPVCLDTTPKCLIPETSDMCPKSITLTPIPTKGIITKVGCKIGGCSKEICQNLTDESIASICIYKASFACYKTAKCEVQQNGKCGWTQTPELNSCISNSK